MNPLATAPDITSPQRALISSVGKSPMPIVHARRVKRIAISLAIAFACINNSSLAQNADDDFSGHGRGAVLTPPELLEKISSTPAFRAFLPRRLDLSEKMPLPDAIGQRKVGSCVAWATAYAARAYYVRTVDGFDNRNRNNIPSPAYLYDTYLSNKTPYGTPNNCSQGSYIPALLEILKAGGVPSIREYPALANACPRPTATDDSLAKRFQISDYYQVGSKTDNNRLDSIKGELANGNPVIVALALYLPNGPDKAGPLDSLKAGETYRIPQAPARDSQYNLIVVPPYESHGMTVVGYDEERQAFKLINSWGRNWADQGYGWIDYQTFKANLEEAYAMRVVSLQELGAPTCSLVAYPASIAKGGTATLSYSSQHSDSGSIDNEIGNVDGSVGIVSVSPSQSTRYVATFRSAGRSATCTAEVSVTMPQTVPDKPLITSFLANPQSITHGQQTILSWSVDGARSLAIDNGIGIVNGNSVVVAPKSSATYTIEAKNGSGVAIATTTVNVSAPAPFPTPPQAPTCALSIVPSAIERGNTATLSYISQNADGGKIDNDVGTVLATGSKSISPAQTTSYSGSFSGAAGTATCRATIIVSEPRPAPPIPSQKIVLPDVQCGKIALARRGEKTVVEGFVGYDKDFELVRASAPGVEIDVMVRPWPQCEALQTLDKAMSLPDRPTVSIRRLSGDTLTAGDPLIFDIQTPSYPSYIHVAYIQADGSVLNLIQPGDGSFRAYSPRSKIVIGADPGGRHFSVQKPFGREMLIVLVGRSPTFPDRRPKQETEREFLTALRRALLAKADPNAADRDIVASFDAIITKDK
jgi:hypothetical protein